MAGGSERLSTGLPGLDQVLHGLIPGDNVVLSVDTVEDYVPFVDAYTTAAIGDGRRLIYFRFAHHAALVPESAAVETYRLRPEIGFEKFLTEIIDVIEAAGVGAYYVFDCLSELAVDWYSDRMLANFFMIACPFLYRLETITYFGLLRNRHSPHALDGIRNTAQVIIEVYRNHDQLFVQPLKVDGRYSSTMYTLHAWEGGSFVPVTSSVTISEILANLPQPWLDFSIYRPGVWLNTFREAQSALDEAERGRRPMAEAQAYFGRLVRMAVTRDERFIRLAERYFSLSDLIDILKRMIGTGLIGGKSLGMLLARAILRRADPRWSTALEPHDSFFVGSDVFYTFIVQNGCWWFRREMRKLDMGSLLGGATEARQRIQAGTFPEYIQHQFKEMLDYFGQSPLIVRSSSLLEDNYGNAFSGKYRSVFCANQGTPDERLNAFVAAVREVYASTMSEDALVYRVQRGLLDLDEQMSLLVQRVSGTAYGSRFFPQVAGVGFSFNPYVWSEDIDPKAGVLRLVAGLGTRAVDRTGDDYTRVVALNAPHKRHEANPQDVRRYSQRQLDMLDLAANRLTAEEFADVARVPNGYPLDLFGIPEDAAAATASPGGRDLTWLLSFDSFFRRSDFVATMRDMLRTLQEAYQSPVDVEFTGNYGEDGRGRISLVQCRPFQVRVGGSAVRVQMPSDLPPQQLLLETRGPIIGHSAAIGIDRIVYVDPEVYGTMAMRDRHSVARLIGRLNRLDAAGPARALMLIGPGRWGTSTPALGVPVSFAEISRVSVICEVALMHQGLVPDVSLGTHFFNDLVELDMLYLAVTPGKPGNVLNRDIFRSADNRLTALLPDAEKLAAAVIVVDCGLPPGGLGAVSVHADSLAQRAVCSLTALARQVEPEGTNPSS